MVVKYVLNRDRGVLHIKTCFAAKNIFHSEVPTVFLVLSPLPHPVRDCGQ